MRELLEDLPELWGEATMGEQQTLLLTMLDAVHFDDREEAGSSHKAQGSVQIPL